MARTKFTAIRRPIESPATNMHHCARKSVPTEAASRKIVDKTSSQSSVSVRGDTNQNEPTSSKRKRLSRLTATRSIKPQKKANQASRVSKRIVVKKDVVSKRFAKFSIPKKAFQRLVREIVSEIKPEMRFQPEALFALQTVCEEFLAGMFEDANLCTMHARRKTLMVKDMDLVKKHKGLDHLISKD